MFGCDQRRNLGERARSRAITLGVVVGGIALLWALLATELGTERRLGWLAALPLAASAYLIISGTLGICIYNGVKGHRGADYGREAILDPTQRAELRTRALVAVSASLLIGVAFAAAIMSSG